MTANEINIRLEKINSNMLKNTLNCFEIIKTYGLTLWYFVEKDLTCLS